MISSCTKNICCRRFLSFWIFIIFGLLAVGTSYQVYIDIDDERPLHYTLIMYIILLITSPKYLYRLGKSKRCFFAILTFVMYIVYWACMFTLRQMLGDLNIYWSMACSVVTAFVDVMIFSKYFNDPEINDQLRIGLNSGSDEFVNVV
jgi:hypothetical protein